MDKTNIVKKLMAHPDYAKLVRRIEKDKRKKRKEIEKHIGAWIDNNDGVYSPIDISSKMLQLAKQFGAPVNKLPSLCDVFDYDKNCLWFEQHHHELQRDLEDLLNEYCTTDLTCWAWHDNAFGLWNTSEIYDEELA